MKTADTEEIQAAIQAKLVEAKRLVDEAKELAESINVDIGFIGATYSWDEECWTVNRPWKQVNFQWSESSHCLEYD